MYSICLMYLSQLSCLDGRCAPNLILSRFSRFWPILLLFLTTQRKVLTFAKMKADIRLIFKFTESTCLRLLAHQIWLLNLSPMKS